MAIAGPNAAAATEALAPALINSRRFNFRGMTAPPDFVAPAFRRARHAHNRECSPEGGATASAAGRTAGSLRAGKVDFLGRIGARNRLKHFFLAVFIPRPDLNRQRRSEFATPVDSELFESCEAKRLRRLARAILESSTPMPSRLLRWMRS